MLQTEKIEFMKDESKKTEEKSELEQYADLLTFEFSDWRLSQLADRIKLGNCRPKFKTINF